jgi:putative membrane protein
LKGVSNLLDDCSLVSRHFNMLEALLENRLRGLDVTAEGSLSQSMDKAVKSYSSLFTLPTYRRAVYLLALICVSSGLLSAVIIFPLFEGIINGLILGFSLLIINLILDYALSILVFSQDQIYDLRRATALSLFCWVAWFFFILVGVAAAALDLSWWIRMCFLGFSAALILRSVVFYSTSSLNHKRLITASFLQPFSCIILFLVFWAKIAPITSSMFLFLILSPTISLVSTFFFIFLINRVGEQMLGISSLSLFKAFLLNWIVDLNAPFEELLEKLGEKHDVEISLVKFGSPKLKAFIVVPSVHPGPFKNVGSSLLPSMLKNALENELNCVVGVPHGLLGHEFDLASQQQNQKIINHVAEFADFEAHEAKATPFIKVSNGLATACCQIFGKFAFLSFTLAPKTTEDLPQELGLFARQKAEKNGLTCCVVVNAHNSIDGKIDLQEVLDVLKTAADTCLEKTVSLKQLPFEVGTATVIPKEYGLKDGMGPGGITVFVVKVGEQKTAYVVVDGNNMVSGLREKILSALHLIGIDEGEIYTTDTHSVNAVILNERGYHPVGDAVDHEILIGHIKEATLAALSNLERAKAACRNTTVSDIKVIGEKQLETLCLLIDKTRQKAKKTVIPIFATSGLLLMLFLMFF